MSMSSGMAEVLGGVMDLKGWMDSYWSGVIDKVEGPKKAVVQGQGKKRGQEGGGGKGGDKNNTKISRAN